MAAKTQTFPLEQYDADEALALCYGRFLQLGWLPKFAGPNRLAAYAKMSWGKPQEIVVAEVADGVLTVTSQLADTAGWDVFNKNKKNLSRFAAVWQTPEPSANVVQLSQWQEELRGLRLQTKETLEKEKAQREEVDRVMNLSGGGQVVTYTIIGLNVAVFLLMVLSGVSFFSPTNLDIANWGGNYKPITVDEGQWWRLVTSTFVHIGIIHLLFNMYALYMAGIYLERMLGKLRYAIAYVVTGVAASLTSIQWHGNEVISAGASGAIFGLYGLFLALLTTSLIPKAVRKALLQSIGIFIFYNLAYGIKAGVDNAAHLGGLVSGFFVGYLYFPWLKNLQRAKTTSVDQALQEDADILS